MKEYEIKEIRGLEWHELGDNKYLLKNVLDENRIKKYVDDEWYRNGCEVRHNDNVREKFDWDKSYIKNIVLENFKKDLDIECEVTLLTKEEVENLPDEIRKSDDWYWTRTGYDDYTFACAWFVGSDGYVGDSYVNYTNAVRPVLILKSETFQEINARAKSCGDIQLPNELISNGNDELKEAVNQMIRYFRNKE